MTIHNQGQTGLCWDYAAASSIRKSLLLRIGKQKIFEMEDTSEFRQITRKSREKKRAGVH